jgi:TonB family protein
MSEAVRSKRARRRRSAGWKVALAASAVVHGGALLLVYAYGRSPAAAETVELNVGALASAAVPLVAPLPEASRLEVAVVDQPPPIERPSQARPGEADDPSAGTRAPADADGRERLAPAPDSGLAGGAPLAHAFRLDRSTLRARLSDGAAEAQPARLRISRRRASPQAIRQEAKVGIGDSVAAADPTRAPIATPASGAAPALGGEPAGASGAVASAGSDAPRIVARLDTTSSPVHGVGPLDAEPGARRFDVQTPGRAADDLRQRAASNEAHPALIDYSRPAAPAPAPSAEGRGPGATAGAVAAAATGTAPAVYGAPAPEITSLELSERTRDRHYDRYYQEILQRVNAVDDFPKALALRLEQGETIVQFVIGVDGRLIDGPRVLKTAGFQEFDAAAMRKVRRAAPFPPLPNPGAVRSLRMSLRVSFDNPVIR